MRILLPPGQPHIVPYPTLTFSSITLPYHLSLCYFASYSSPPSSTVSPNHTHSFPSTSTPSCLPLASLITLLLPNHLYLSPIHHTLLHSLPLTPSLSAYYHLHISLPTQIYGLPFTHKHTSTSLLTLPLLYGEACCRLLFFILTVYFAHGQHPILCKKKFSTITYTTTNSNPLAIHPLRPMHLPTPPSQCDLILANISG